VSLDPTGRAPGRGAYLCRDTACWETAGRKHAFEHALEVSAAAVTALLAAGPDGFEPTATSQPVNRVSGSPPIESDSNVYEGGARGQE
jgi:hypothetical protein